MNLAQHAKQVQALEMRLAHAQQNDGAIDCSHDELLEVQRQEMSRELQRQQLQYQCQQLQDQHQQVTHLELLYLQSQEHGTRLEEELAAQKVRSLDYTREDRVIGQFESIPSLSQGLLHSMMQRWIVFVRGTATRGPGCPAVMFLSSWSFHHGLLIIVG